MLCGGHAAPADGNLGGNESVICFMHSKKTHMHALSGQAPTDLADAQSLQMTTMTQGVNTRPGLLFKTNSSLCCIRWKT